MAKSFLRAPGPISCLLTLLTTVPLGGCAVENARPFGGGGVGSGGDHEPWPGATGGAAGTGGMSGSPGSGGAQTGGRTGTGGTLGTAGMGGAPRTGGHTGTGGANPANPVMCEQLALAYQDEMANAKDCSPGAAIPQCQARVSGSLECSGTCFTYVQNPVRLNDVRQKWVSNNCDSLARPCPAILCATSQPGNCFVAGTAPTPRCHDSPTAQN